MADSCVGEAEGWGSTAGTAGTAHQSIATSAAESGLVSSPMTSSVHGGLGGVGVETTGVPGFAVVAEDERAGRRRPGNRLAATVLLLGDVVVGLDDDRQAAVLGVAGAAADPKEAAKRMVAGERHVIDREAGNDLLTLGVGNRLAALRNWSIPSDSATGRRSIHWR